MSQRNRTNRYPTARDGEQRSAGARASSEGTGPLPQPRTERRPDSAPRLIPEREETPWNVDPADVDRYLEERALAQPAPTLPRPSARSTPAGPTPTVGPRRSTPAADEPGPRRVSAPSSRPALGDPTDPSQWDDTAAEAWVETEVVDAPEAVEPAAPMVPARRPVPARSRMRAARPATRPTLPPMPRLHIPPVIAQSDLARDHAALWLLGIAAFGLGVMAALMSNQLGGLDPGIGIHVDAAGRTDRWGDPTGLWRLPLLATMITLMNGVAAWFLASADRFAARFLLAAAVVIQLIVWVAVVDFL